MYGGMIKVVALAGRRDELLAFLEWDARVAANEPGTLRFDVWEVPGEIDAFYLYEGYLDRDAFAAHQEGEPYQHFVSHILGEVIAPIVEVLPFTDCFATSG